MLSLELCLAVLETEEERAEFTDLFERYHKLVLYKAGEIIGDYEKAEDVAQEVFLYIAENFSRFRREDHRKVTHYLMMCAYSRALNFMRQQKNRAAVEEEEPFVAKFSVEDTERIVLRQDTLKRVMQAVAELAEKYRAPLQMRLEGAPYEEIAGLLGITGDTARKRVQRGYAMIREKVVECDEV